VGHSQQVWEAQLAKLEAYKAEHGDCNVPKGWAEDPRLANWVGTQRANKRKLDRGEPSDGMTVERAARLDALGFSWDYSAHLLLLDAKWEAQLTKLASYKAVHGDCHVPRSWAADQELANWVNNQRQHKQKLDRGEPSRAPAGPGHRRQQAYMTAERVARLDALGFVWVEAEAERESQLARLTAYKAAHGDCNVPTGWAVDAQLASWVYTQRLYRRMLDPDEISKAMAATWVRLTALGFEWDAPREGEDCLGDGAESYDSTWEAQLARLRAYKVAHGDCRVPCHWAEDQRLGSWVNKQRQLKRKLDRGEPSEGMTAEQAARLDALGFTWTLPQLDAEELEASAA
jgi:hypothetical protein